MCERVISVSLSQGVNAVQRTRRLNIWRKVAAALPRLTWLEWSFVALVVFCYVFFLEPANTNSLSRYDMVSALAHGTAIIDYHAGNTIDVSLYHGHYYSPRSIGLSLVAVPVLAALHVIEALRHDTTTLTIQIALLNMFTVVPVAIIAIIAFERFVLRLRPALARTSLPLVAAGSLGLGTLFFPFALAFFSHAFGGALAFLAFFLLYRARESLHPEWHALGAGLLMGLAIISEYPTGVIMIILAVYIFFVFPQRRIPMLIWFAIGMAPSALILGWYDWFAFGNPLHISYEYVAGTEFVGQKDGLFGVTLPRLGAYWEILVWPRGLLVESPFLIFVVLGFWRWLRSAARPPAEALVCIAVTIAYSSVVASYFLPMAGENLPGPRLLVPMLPFTCLSLAWIVGHPSRLLRSVYGVLLAFGTVATYLYVVLGVREYHTYVTYPIKELFLPVMRTGNVPKLNGDTPPNLATLWFHLPQNISIYIMLIPLLAWIAFALRALWIGAGDSSAQKAPLGASESGSGSTTSGTVALASTTGEDL